MLDDSVRFLVDVGTDHAYLPIYLAKNKCIESIIAVDCLKGPILNAEKNIKKYKVEDIVKTRISDGLKKVNSSEADAVVIAGMGAENIIKIINEAKWLKDENKTLILQPMTRENLLREYLLKNNYEIHKESVVLDLKKIYVVIKAKYNKNFFTKNINFSIYPYTGTLLNGPVSEEIKLYLKIKIIKINKILKGAVKSKNKEQVSKIEKIKKELEKALKR